MTCYWPQRWQWIHPNVFRIFVITFNETCRRKGKRPWAQSAAWPDLTWVYGDDTELGKFCWNVNRHISVASVALRLGHKTLLPLRRRGEKTNNTQIKSHFIIYGLPGVKECHFCDCAAGGLILCRNAHSFSQAGIKEHRFVELKPSSSKPQVLMLFFPLSLYEDVRSWTETTYSEIQQLLETS